MKSYGLIHEESYRPKDWHFGGVSGIDNEEILQPDGQWDIYLPKFESQRFQYSPTRGFDTMSCVSFGTLNCIETLHKRLYGSERNFSDRFTAVMSGTTARGNTFYNVAESIRKYGLVDEERWPYYESIKSFSAYHSPVSEEAKALGRKFLDEYEYGYEFVWDTPERLMEALKYSPVLVGVYSWCPKDGEFYSRCDTRGQHALMLYGYEEGKYWKLYDHYTRDGGYRMVAWDYRFWGTMKHSIKKKTHNSAPMKKLEEGVFYQLVEGKGGFILMAAGKPRWDDLAKLIASHNVRNNGDVKGKFDTLTLADIDGIQLFNLKGEHVSPELK